MWPERTTELASVGHLARMIISLNLALVDMESASSIIGSSESDRRGRGRKDDWVSLVGHRLMHSLSTPLPGYLHMSFSWTGRAITQLQ